MSAHVAVWKEVLITSFTQQVLQANTSAHGLLNLKSICTKEYVSRSGIVAAHDVNGVAPQQPFYIFASDCNNSPTRLYNGEKIAVERKPLKCIFNHASSDVDTFPIYKESKYQETQMDQHGQLQNANEDASKRDYKKDEKTAKNMSKTGRALSEC